MASILGIDPGMSGALAFFDGDQLCIYDMPVLERNKTKRVNSRAIYKWLIEHEPNEAWVEQVNAFGMGATSAYNFGWNCGVLEATLLNFGVPINYVTPQVWKKAMNCPKDKNETRGRASVLMPLFSHNWELKKHDGRAEAALIALYGINKNR